MFAISIYMYTGSKINCLNMVATRAPKVKNLGARNKLW